MMNANTDNPPRPSVQRMVRCWECRYWHDLEGDNDVERLGECRRFPPMAMDCQLDPTARIRMGQYRGVWPETPARDFCGEGTPNDRGQAQPLRATEADRKNV